MKIPKYAYALLAIFAIWTAYQIPDKPESVEVTIPEKFSGPVAKTTITNRIVDEKQEGRWAILVNAKVDPNASEIERLTLLLLSPKVNMADTLATR